MKWYTQDPVYDSILLFAFILAAAAAVGAFILKTPYGRFGEGRAGIKMSPRLGWFLMELPASVVFLAFYFTGARPFEPVSLVFLFIWCVHYLNRGFLFPFMIRVSPGHRQTFNLSVVASGWIVTSMHGYLNAAFITTLGGHFSTGWLSDPRFIAGAAVYYSGLFLNLHSDRILRNLRPAGPVPEGPRYRVPSGGGFRFVSCPQYLGELIAWSGFALCTWSLAGVFILLISAANLVPRAVSTHAWYRDTFPEYPPERKALVPFLF